MTNTVQSGDFVQINYIGRLMNGSIFDTNKEDVAKQAGLHKANAKYNPLTVCVGQKQLLPGLDAKLVGKDCGKTFQVELEAAEAFGKRDVKKIQLVPIAAFQEHKMVPRQGMQVDFDGKLGTIMRINGGRVMVNFNHPLAGKTVSYEVELIKKIEDATAQLKSLLRSSLQLPEQMLEINVAAKKATVTLPFELPAQFTKALGDKLVELVPGIESLEFAAKKQEAPKASPAPNAQK